MFWMHPAEPTVPPFIAIYRLELEPVSTELEFDFSGVAERTDYDRIVIQFGAEGHAGTGFFYFDDFTFAE